MTASPVLTKTIGISEVAALNTNFPDRWSGDQTIM
jgi:hypothetical protein